MNDLARRTPNDVAPCGHGSTMEINQNIANSSHTTAGWGRGGRPRTPVTTTSPEGARVEDRAPSAAPARPRPGPHRQGPRLRPFRTPVRGYAFAAPPVSDHRLAVGLEATLAREPTNPADSLAIAVWVHDTTTHPWRLGYLDRAVAARLAPRMDAGTDVRACLDGWVAEPGGRWQRPVLLLLPVAATSSASEPSEPSGFSEPDAGRGRSVQGLPAAWNRPPGVRRRRILGHGGTPEAN